MKIYDISVALSRNTPTYPGDLPLEMSPSATIETDGFSVTRLALSSHTGTHIDAPSHFLRGGSGVDRISPLITCGSAFVAEVACRKIGAEDLRKLDLHGCERLLLKAPGRSILQREIADSPCLTLDAAQFLARSGLRLLGIDSLSVEAVGGSGDVHRELLSAGIVLLETIDLSDVPPGWYDLVCLPLRIEDADGAPARAVLLQQEE